MEKQKHRIKALYQDDPAVSGEEITQTQNSLSPQALFLLTKILMIFFLWIIKIQGF